MRQLSEHERLRIHTLYHDAKWTYRRIQEHLNVTENQVRLAIRRIEIAPRSGRPVTMSPEDDAELLAFLSQSKQHRRMPYHEIAARFQGGTRTIKVLRGAFRRLGLTEPLARPSLSSRTNPRTPRAGGSRRHPGSNRAECEDGSGTASLATDTETVQPQSESASCPTLPSTGHESEPGESASCQAPPSASHDTSLNESVSYQASPSPSHDSEPSEPTEMLRDV